MGEEGAFWLVYIEFSLFKKNQQTKQKGEETQQDTHSTSIVIVAVFSNYLKMIEPNGGKDVQAISKKKSSKGKYILCIHL